MSRREFVELAIGYVAVTGFLDIAGVTPSRNLIRPPGALPEDRFLQMCIRCRACADVCPVRTLGLADLTDGIKNIGTPKLDGYCMIFKGLQNPNPKKALEWKKKTRANGQEETCYECINVCPTGALEPIDFKQIHMGTAVVDKELCKAWRYGNCTFDCVDTCPVDAISVTVGPEVDEAKCNGCNQCNYACVIRPIRAIAVTPSLNW